MRALKFPKLEEQQMYLKEKVILSKKSIGSNVLEQPLFK